MSTDARSGPDEKFNGLALCTLHHKLFDRGIFTLSDELNIVGTFRNHTGRRASGNVVVAVHGAALRPRQSPNYYPAKSVVQWHVREVFQGPERYKAPA